MLFSACAKRAFTSASADCAMRLPRSAASTSRSAIAPAANRVFARCSSRAACSAATIACVRADLADSSASRTAASSIRAITVPASTRWPDSTYVCCTAPASSDRMRASRSATSVPEIGGPLRNVSVRATAMLSGPMVCVGATVVVVVASPFFAHALTAREIATKGSKNAGARRVVVIMACCLE